jgi:hypothetical protein
MESRPNPSYPYPPYVGQQAQHLYHPFMYTMSQDLGGTIDMAQLREIFEDDEETQGQDPARQSLE